MHDDVLQELIHLFSKLPGIGPKSASRMVLFLLKNKEKLMYPLSRSLLSAGEAIKKCKDCGNISIVNPTNNIFKCVLCKNNTNFSQIRIPYTCKLLFQEILCMSINTKFITK